MDDPPRAIYCYRTHSPPIRSRRHSPKVVDSFSIAYVVDASICILRFASLPHPAPPPYLFSPRRVEPATMMNGNVLEPTNSLVGPMLTDLYQITM